MKERLLTVLSKLNSKGYSQAGLARHISEKTGETYLPSTVGNALHYWVGRESCNTSPRGKTLKVLEITSEIIGESATPAIADYLNKRHRPAA